MFQNGAGQTCPVGWCRHSAEFIDDDETSVGGKAHGSRDLPELYLEAALFLFYLATATVGGSDKYPGYPLPRPEPSENRVRDANYGTFRGNKTTDVCHVGDERKLLQITRFSEEPRSSQNDSARIPLRLPNGFAIGPDLIASDCQTAIVCNVFIAAQLLQWIPALLYIDDISFGHYRTVVPVLDGDFGK
jgi:hypothetical protein